MSEENKLEQEKEEPGNIHCDYMHPEECEKEAEKDDKKTDKKTTVKIAPSKPVTKSK